VKEGHQMQFPHPETMHRLIEAEAELRRAQAARVRMAQLHDESAEAAPEWEAQEVGRRTPARRVFLRLMHALNVRGAE
jgi:hypothetical protein